MASRKLEDAHPILVDVFKKAEELFQKGHPGVDVIITCTYRSPDEQNQLYTQGRTKKGPRVTNAKGGQSPHNYFPSYAIDVAFVVNGKLDWSTKYFQLFDDYMLAQSNQIVWGGHFQTIPDMPHYEIKNWKSLIKK